MIYELVLRNFDCSLEFVFSLLLLQPFNFSPASFACNFQDWRYVILREIDFLLKICWSIPCLHPSWKVHTWTEICASLNHRKKTKADGSWLIPRKHTETLVLLSVKYVNFNFKILYQFFYRCVKLGLQKCMKQIEWPVIIWSSSLSTFSGSFLDSLGLKTVVLNLSTHSYPLSFR